MEKGTLVIEIWDFEMEFSKTSRLLNIIELVVKVELEGGSVGQRHEP